MKFLFTVLALGFFSPQAFADNWNKQSDVNFAVNPSTLANGSVQFAYDYDVPNKVAAHWSREVDGLGALTMPDVHVLTMKTAFIVSKGIKELQGMDARQAIVHLAPDVQIDGEMPSGCLNASTPLPSIPLPLLPKDMTFSVAMDKNLHPVTGLDKNLGRPALAMTQDAFDFNVMFKTSSNVMHFYPIDATHTLVVAYETYTVKDESIAKAKYIPFFNLQNRLIDKIKSETQGLIARMNS